MKITKKLLRQVIVEELENLSEECHPMDHQCQENEAQRAKKRSDYKKSKENLGEEFRGSFSGKSSAEVGRFLRSLATYVESRAYPINDWLIDAGIKSKNPDDEWSVRLFTALANLKKLAAELPAALDAGPGEAANPNKKPKVDDGYGDGL